MIGKRLGDWVVERELGRGGMGRVYLAHREPPVEGKAEPTGVASEGQPAVAAVKVLSAELAQDVGFLQRFQREIDALAKLDHPNIVHFYESGSHDGRYFYAMEYVAGRNFDELLLERGRLPWTEVLDLALQLCPALKHAHDHGIIHRDLKPQNLLRADDGVVKLADFGVAKVFASRQLTATGGLIGTAEYISPEQAAGKPVTIRSDLYSFGVVLYVLLTGRAPFHGESVLDLLHKHRFAQFDRPQRWVTELPAEFDEVVCGLLAKEPAERPANALLLLRQFESLRRKLERKEQLTVISAHKETTRSDQKDAAVPGDDPGPATLLSQLVRAELARQNRGSPLSQWLNHPAVVVPLFALCLGALLYGLWPASADSLYARGSDLMQSEDPADWDVAWRKYFEPLNRRYPEHPYAEQLEAYRRQIDDRKEVKRPSAQSSASEARRFYLQGQRCRKEGDLVGAQRWWEDVLGAFGGVDSERRWVSLAEKGLAEIRSQLPPDEQRWQPVRAALERARRLDKKEAEKVWRAIEDLYHDDPSAAPILEEVRKCRAARQ